MESVNPDNFKRVDSELAKIDTIVKKQRIAIFISGRGSNMKAILEQSQSGILKDVVEIVLVFSNRPQAEGLVTAKALGFETQAMASKGWKRSQFDQKVLTCLEKYPIDYICLAGYKRILSPAFVRTYPKRIINIHPADTKLHQGLGAYEWAYEKQLKETCITIHYVDEGVDTGTILAQERVDLEGVSSLEEVQARGLAVEHKLYSRTLYTLCDGA